MRIRPASMIVATGLLLALLLSACSRGDSPRRAELITPPPAHTDFGDLRVHHNALPTLALSAAAAKDYQVERNADTALLVIAPRRLLQGEEVATPSQVQAVAIDLQGKRQPIALHAVRTGEYEDYLGTFSVGARDTYRIEATVTSDGRRNVVKFQRTF